MSNDRVRSDDRPRAIPRRRLLTVAAASPLAGCLDLGERGDVSCRAGPERGFSTDAVERAAVSVTSNNAADGGSCDRWSSTLCLQTTLSLDPSTVATVEGRTTDGSVVARTEVESDTVHKLQLAELEPTGTAEREIVLLGHDGEVLDSVPVQVDCSE